MVASNGAGEANEAGPGPQIWAEEFGRCGQASEHEALLEAVSTIAVPGLHQRQVESGDIGICCRNRRRFASSAPSFNIEGSVGIVRNLGKLPEGKVSPGATGRHRHLRYTHIVLDA